MIPDLSCRRPELSGSDTIEKRPQLSSQTARTDHSSQRRDPKAHRRRRVCLCLDGRRTGKAGKGKDSLLLPDVQGKNLRQPFDSGSPQEGGFSGTDERAVRNSPKNHKGLNRRSFHVQRDSFAGAKQRLLFTLFTVRSEYSVKIHSCRAGAVRFRPDGKTNMFPDLRREAWYGKDV